MERSEVLDTMKKLKLYGMKAAYDEIVTTAIKRGTRARAPASSRRSAHGGDQRD